MMTSRRQTSYPEKLTWMRKSRFGKLVLRAYYVSHSARFLSRLLACSNLVAQNYFGYPRSSVFFFVHIFLKSIAFPSTSSLKAEMCIWTLLASASHESLLSSFLKPVLHMRCSASESPPFVTHSWDFWPVLIHGSMLLPGHHPRPS